jgi:hypothetical protein
MSKNFLKQGTKYLQETKLAVGLALDLIEKRKQHIEKIVSLSGGVVADSAEEAERLAWEKYEKNRTKIEAYAKELTKKEFSTAVMAGAVLQIAKQGLSLVLSKKPEPSQGRQIRSVHSSDIIWAGRNQAIHFEEGHFHKHTYEIFDKLAINHGMRNVHRDISFDLRNPLWKKKSMALNVISLLEWSSYKHYHDDMVLIFSVYVE